MHCFSKRVYSSLLCAALLLTLAGCSKPRDTGSSQAIFNIDGTGTNSTQGAMGRWVEEKIDLGTPYELFGAPTQLADGTLRLYVREPAATPDELPIDIPIRQLDSKDGGTTWSETPCQLNDTETDIINSITVAPNGGVLMLGYQLGEGRSDRRFAVYYAAAGEKPQPVPFDAASPLLTNDPTHPDNEYSAAGPSAAAIFEGQPQISQYGFLSDTLAYATKTPTFSPEGEQDTLDITFLFEPITGKIVAKLDIGKGYSTGYLSAPASYAGGLLHMDYDADGKRTLYGVDTSGASTQRLAGIEAGRGVSAACTDAEGNYYFIGKTGIYRVAAGGTLAELVVDSAGFTFSSDTEIMLLPNSLARTNEGSFFVNEVKTSDYATHTLYRYRFDETLPTVSENAINVWSLSDNATLRAALVAFGQANRDVTVNYTVGMTADSQGVTQEDVLRALNTQILSGAGPDVLVLDSMDASTYIQKGLLTDLSGLVSGDALVPWVKNAYYKPGETYVLPARFCVPVITGPAGKAESLTTLDALRDAILACPPRPVMDGATPEYSATYYEPRTDSQMYGIGFISTAQLVDFALQTSAPALLQDGKVDTAALTQLLSFIEAVGKHSDMGAYPPELQSNGATGGATGTDPVLQMDGGYEFCTTGNAVYAWDNATTPAYLMSINQREHGSNNFRAVSSTLQPGLVAGAYTPGTLLSVSAASEKKETALAFVKMLLSEEVQNGFYQDGMPVLQTAFDASLGRNLKKEDLDYYNIKTDTAAVFGGLQTPVVIDAQVQKVVTAHAQALVAEHETLEAAVAACEKELALYLAERG